MAEHPGNGLIIHHLKQDWPLVLCLDFWDCDKVMETTMLVLMLVVYTWHDSLVINCSQRENSREEGKSLVMLQYSISETRKIARKKTIALLQQVRV